MMAELATSREASGIQALAVATNPPPDPCYPYYCYESIAFVTEVLKPGNCGLLPLWYMQMVVESIYQESTTISYLASTIQRVLN